MQQEAVAEKEYGSRYGAQGDLADVEAAVADALRSHTGEGDEQHAEEFGRNRIGKQAARLLKVVQDAGYGFKFPPGAKDSRMAVPIYVYDKKQEADGPKKVHHFG